MVRRKQPPKFETRDLEAALESLFDDELRPDGLHLRKRLLEQTGAKSVSEKELRSACEASASITVQPIGQGKDEWVALLLGKDQPFVDAGAGDVYPPQLWEDLEAFCIGPGRGMRLPGGRYEVVRELQRLRLPFLEGRSLGEICHIVQLALSQKKKILGYADGCIAPYRESEAMLKEQCALLEQPCSAASKPPDAAQGLPVASWEDARSCLREMLMQAGGKVPLANVKRIFRFRFNMELSETAFGHTRISDLMRDDRLQDICRLELQSNGYVLIDMSPSSAMGKGEHAVAKSSSRRSRSTTEQFVSDGPSSVAAGSPTDQIRSTFKTVSSNVPANFTVESEKGPCHVSSFPCKISSFLGWAFSSEDQKVLPADKPAYLLPSSTTGQLLLDSPPEASDSRNSSLPSKKMLVHEPPGIIGDSNSLEARYLEALRIRAERSNGYTDFDQFLGVASCLALSTDEPSPESDSSPPFDPPFDPLGLHDEAKVLRQREQSNGRALMFFVSKMTVDMVPVCGPSAVRNATLRLSSASTAQLQQTPTELAYVPEDDASPAVASSSDFKNRLTDISMTSSAEWRNQLGDSGIFFSGRFFRNNLHGREGPSAPPGLESEMASPIPDLSWGYDPFQNDYT